MPTRPSKREDALQAAARIVERTTGQPLPKLTETPLLSDEDKALRSQAASILGKMGGRKGGLKRAENLTPERRKEIAQQAAQKRWQPSKG